MSDRRTFIDPETGEEIESTWLARLGTLVVSALSTGIIGGVAVGLLGQVVGIGVGLTEGLLVGFIAASAVALSVVGLAVMLSQGAFRRLVDHPSNRRLHNAIARWQHRRRKAKAGQQL